MDQSAFRSLISAPRDPATSSSSGSKKALGKAAPKRGWGIKAKDSKAYEKPKEPAEEKPAFAPRATHKRILEEGGYKDRAALRRKGVDDEYKPVEKLLEDFERTAKESGAAEEEIDKQRAYLGGDAEHSILVKGLDYALLAARKAELAREHEEVADDELDELVKDVGKTSKGKAVKGKDTDEVKKQAEADRLGKGFKSIGQKEAELAEKKKKKKKKKVVARTEEPVVAVKKQVATAETRRDAVGNPPLAGPSKVAPPPPKPEIIEEDEDIFADAGEYDLNANLPSDDDEDEEVAPIRRSGRSESRSRSRSRSHEREGRRDRSRSRSWDERDGRSARRRSYADSRSRSRSRSRSWRREDSRSRSRERDDDRRPRNLSEGRTRQLSRERRNQGRSRERNGYDDDHRRHGDYDRQRYDEYRGSGRNASVRGKEGDGYRNDDSRYARRERSFSPDGDGGHKRRRYDSPSPPRRKSDNRQDYRDRYDSRSPPRRPHSPPRQSRGSQSPIFRSASPPRRNPAPIRGRRSPSRSATPPLFTTMPPPLSRSPSPTSSQEENQPYRIPRKLAPLRGSAIADVGAFLSYDKDAAKADEKRAKKAAWRAKQGLGPQEGDAAGGGGGGSGGGDGDSDYANKKKDGVERMRANNDYVKIMKKMEEKGA